MNALGNENCSEVLNEMNLDNGHEKGLELYSKSADLLKEIGIDARSIGFMILRDAISDSEDLDVKKEILYSKIAEKWDTIVPSIENYMFSAIHVAWKKDRRPFKEKLGFSKYPTEREFIAMCRLYLQVG